jgi:hypothetical protein
VDCITDGAVGAGFYGCVYVSTLLSVNSNIWDDCFRYAYLEYGTEEEASEAAKKHRSTELAGQKLYVIKSMTVRAESFG